MIFIPCEHTIGMPRSMWVVMSRFALPASGSLLQVSEYMSLFIAIGRTYGGASGAGTFRLPDLMTGNRYMRAAGGTLDVGTIEDDATAINGVRVATVSTTLQQCLRVPLVRYRKTSQCTELYL